MINSNYFCYYVAQITRFECKHSVRELQLCIWMVWRDACSPNNAKPITRSYRRARRIARQLRPTKSMLDCAILYMVYGLVKAIRDGKRTHTHQIATRTFASATRRPVYKRRDVEQGIIFIYNFEFIFVNLICVRARSAGSYRETTATTTTNPKVASLLMKYALAPETPRW